MSWRHKYSDMSTCLGTSVDGLNSLEEAMSIPSVSKPRPIQTSTLETQTPNVPTTNFLTPPSSQPNPTKALLECEGGFSIDSYPVFENIYTIFRHAYFGPWSSFAEADDVQLETWWTMFKNTYSWNPVQEDAIQKRFYEVGSTYLDAILRNEHLKVDRGEVPPKWIKEEYWLELRAKREKLHVKNIRAKNKASQAESCPLTCKRPRTHPVPNEDPLTCIRPDPTIPSSPPDSMSLRHKYSGINVPSTTPGTSLDSLPSTSLDTSLFDSLNCSEEGDSSEEATSIPVVSMPRPIQTTTLETQTPNVPTTDRLPSTSLGTSLNSLDGSEEGDSSEEATSIPAVSIPQPIQTTTLETQTPNVPTTDVLTLPSSQPEPDPDPTKDFLPREGGHSFDSYPVFMSIYRIFRYFYFGPWSSFSEADDGQLETWWQMFKITYFWNPVQEDAIRKRFNEVASNSLDAILRNEHLKVDRGEAPPKWIKEEYWLEMRAKRVKLQIEMEGTDSCSS